MAGCILNQTESLVFDYYERGNREREGKRSAAEKQREEVLGMQHS